MSSLRRTDLLTLSNLRIDGRKPNEIRHMTIQLSPPSLTPSSCTTTGSSLVRMGLTTVAASIIGPTDCTRRSDEVADRAIIDLHLRIAPFASSSGDRRTVNSTSDRRVVEHVSLIRNALEASVMTHLYPRTRIVVDITVLADDGGRLCAAINAATCALVDAGVPMKDLVCACSAGLVTGASSSGGGGGGGGSSSATGSGGLEDVTLVDLNQKEASAYSGDSSVYMPCAMMPQRNTVVLAQCESRLSSIDVFEKVLGAAMEGCRMVYQVMEASIRERTSKVIAAKMGNAVIKQNFQ